MTKRIVSLFLLAGMLSGGLVYVARVRRAAAAESSTLLQLAPADSVLIAYVDLASLRSSPLFGQLAAATQPAQVDKDYTDFVAATGFDYKQDLDRVLITSRSATASGDALFFAEGRFNREKIQQYALRSGKQQGEAGHTYYVVPTATPGKTLWFTFLGGNRMALSNNNAGLSAAFSSPKPLDPAMQERLSRVSGAPVFAAIKASAYISANAPSGGGVKSPVAGLAAPFAALQWVSLAARPDGEQLVLSAEGECNRPEDAQGVANALQLMRAIGHSALADPRGRSQVPASSTAALGKLLDSMNVTTEADRVRLLVSLPPELLHLAVPPPNGQPAPAAH